MKFDWSICNAKTLTATISLIAFGLTGMLNAQETTVEQPVAPKKTPTRVSKTMTPAEGYARKEMFSAMEQGAIKVELIPKDATQASIFVTNLSEEALAIEMPEAFVGVPVLAQAGGFGNGGGQQGGFGNQGGGGGGQGQQGGNQGFGGGGGQGQQGGGFGNGGGQQGGFGNGGGGGIFNIPPGKRARVKVTTVCLEFHKEDPRPSLKYEIKPVDEYVKDQSVIEMLKMLANDEVTQPVAQAAAWHRMDGLSWESLAQHNRKELSNGYFERFFAADHIHWAQQLIPFVDRRVAELKSQQTEGLSDSRQWNSNQ